MNRQSLALVVSIVFFATPSTEGGAVEEIVGRYSREGNDATIGVYMERPGVVPVSANVGHNRWESPTSVFDNFGIGSTTKMFTATAVLQLAEQGKLSLDDFVKQYISAEIVNGLTGGNAGAVRVRHLLAHTSGIGDYVNIDQNIFEVYDMSRDAVYTPEQIYNYTMQYSPPAFTLGSLGLTSYDDVTASAYSNTGYVMLGEIIASVAGMDWEDYVEQHIFEPAGMRRSGFVGRGIPTVDGHASGVLPGEILSPGSLTDSAGNMYSTPRDLAVFLRSWLNGELFADRQTLHTMLQGQRGAMIHGMLPYGYGVMNQTVGDLGVLIGHTGQSFGFSCALFYHVQTDTVYAVIINDSQQDATAVLQALIVSDFSWGWPEEEPTCGMIYDLGDAACDNLTEACPAYSQCRALIALGLDTCTDNDTYLADIREANASMGLVCSPCGQAFMPLSEMLEDDGVCGGENIMSMCQTGTSCNSAVEAVTSTCTDDDTYFDDGEEKKVLDLVAQLDMVCEPTTCVRTPPRDHPIWTNPIMANKKPKECH